MNKGILIRYYSISGSSAIRVSEISGNRSAEEIRLEGKFIVDAFETCNGKFVEMKSSNGVLMPSLLFNLLSLGS
jgi:hypothetical protein